MGRVPVFLLPFVVLLSNYPGSVADGMLLLLGLAWFFPLVLSNVLVDLFVHQIESRKALVGRKAWMLQSTVGALAPALASFWVVPVADSLVMAGRGCAIFFCSFFGLLSARMVAVRIASGNEFVAGLSNISRVLVLLVLVLKPGAVITWLLFAAALAELLRLLVLAMGPRLDGVVLQARLPESSFHLISGALLVAIAQYSQRWMIAHEEAGNVLLFDVADKVYSLVAMGLTVGLSGVLQRHISKTMQNETGKGIRKFLLAGFFIGLSGAAFCVLSIAVFEYINTLFKWVSAPDVERIETLVWVMAIGFVPAMMTMVVSRAFVATSRGLETLYLSIFSCVAIIFGSWYAVGVWGVAGVALVSSLNNFLVFALYLTVFRYSK